VTSWRLVADVGGSNVRFAKSTGGGELAERRSFALKDFPSFYAGMETYLGDTGGMGGCSGAAVGVAGPVDGGYVRLTNADWTIQTTDVQRLLDGAPSHVINDLEAVALALPHLHDGDLRAVGPAERQRGARRTMLALNVGTGFGAAAIVPAGQDWAPVPGEPGHMSLGAIDAAQLDMLNGARSVEDVLSGRGVLHLYRSIAQRMGQSGDGLPASEIFARAGDDRVAAETLRQFSILFGRVAGDLAVATGAWGGVYLCGSVVNGWLNAGGGNFFRDPFEDKGPMSPRMRNVYSGLISCADVGLVGLSFLSNRP
jgi:glucokinase